MTHCAPCRRHMVTALALGARGLGQVWPNPAVGCLIVKEGIVVGRGWTQPGGRPHAETVALSQAGRMAEGADVYVSLEPCAHIGKTPPCADALAAAGVARVIVAHRDPDPRVSGNGISMLRSAGIEVVEDFCRDEAAEAHAGFFKKVTEGLPLVTLKLATSFDGRIATASGESRWITGPQARRFVHALRMRHDAVLVGAGTARADNPDLTVRGLGPVANPVRVALSRTLSIDPESRLGLSARKTPVWILHGANEEDLSSANVDAWRNTGARLLPVSVARGGQIDLSEAMRVLASNGITRLFCEGGGALAAALLTEGLVDRVFGFTAGLALGAEGLPSLGAMGMDSLSEARRFRLVETRRLGDDVCHIWRV